MYSSRDSFPIPLYIISGCGEAMDTADVLFVPIPRRETRAFYKIHFDGVDMDALSAR
jgi:hypothetical protein